MRYLVLIYGNEQQWASMTPEATAEVMEQYEAYAGEMAAAGVLRGGNELQPSFTATTIRIRDGKPHTTDGPFAETKEQLGGFFLIETATLDEAIAWASRCPGATDGSVEVRPVAEHPAPTAGDGAERMAEAQIAG